MPSCPTFNQVTPKQAKSVGFAGDIGEQQPTLTDELRNQIKATLLELVQNPDNVILTPNAYE